MGYRSAPQVPMARNFPGSEPYHRHKAKTVTQSARMLHAVRAEQPSEILICSAFAIFHAMIAASKTNAESTMNVIIGGLAALFYLLAGGLLARRLAQAGGNVVQPKAGPLALGWGAALLHTLILAQTVFEPVGLNLGFFNALSFTCLLYTSG